MGRGGIHVSGDAENVVYRFPTAGRATVSRVSPSLFQLPC
jgi:hypothetical protein